MSQLRELDVRHNDGIEVRLLWSPADDQVIVTVDDRRAGQRFTIAVRDGESPLDVFHHPYAYVVWHGTRAGGGGPELTAWAA